MYFFNTVIVQRRRKHIQARNIIKSVPRHYDTYPVLPNGVQMVHKAALASGVWSSVQLG